MTNHSALVILSKLDFRTRSPIRITNANPMNSNTKIMNSSFMELNNIRNIPVEKRVYLMPDVTNSGKIKHVYNADGLYSWFAAQRRAYVNSPFTRRRVYVTDIKPLRGNELYLLDYSDAVAASRYLENTPIPN
jgi:hypothetical protein